MLAKRRGRNGNWAAICLNFILRPENYLLVCERGREEEMPVESRSMNAELPAPQLNAFKGQRRDEATRPHSKSKQKALGLLTFYRKFMSKKDERWSLPRSRDLLLLTGYFKVGTINRIRQADEMRREKFRACFGQALLLFKHAPEYWIRLN